MIWVLIMWKVVHWSGLLTIVRNMFSPDLAEIYGSRGRLPEEFSDFSQRPYREFTETL
jgi:hypothetical protein